MTMSKRCTGTIPASRQVVLREVECQSTENSMLPVLPVLPVLPGLRQPLAIGEFGRGVLDLSIHPQLVNLARQGIAAPA